MNPTAVQIIGALFFGLALLHTFAAPAFSRLAHRFPRHQGLWHLLGEVEVVFGLWSLALVLAMIAVEGHTSAVQYVDGRDFTEPLFVFAIMVIAGSRPILQMSALLVEACARLLPIARPLAICFLALALLPLLGSLITEPAAMTMAALMLRDRVLRSHASLRLRYAVLGVLFVNISIGGTLTPFAAPPVLMVADTWGWTLPFMLGAFGWKAALAVLINAAAVTLLFRDALRRAAPRESAVHSQKQAPPGAMVASLLFLCGVVAFAHHPAIFMALLLFFIGYTVAYPRHHDRLILREALLVAFFLAGLVVLGGQQDWWLRPVLTGMTPSAVFFGAAGLTAFTDNAALTYLGSQVQGLSDAFKFSLVAGAVSGGGLTVVANAPNPAGFSILRDRFPGHAIQPHWLAVAALAPTAVALVAFGWL